MEDLAFYRRVHLAVLIHRGGVGEEVAGLGGESGGHLLMIPLEEINLHPVPADLKSVNKVRNFQSFKQSESSFECLST